MEKGTERGNRRGWRRVSFFALLLLWVQLATACAGPGHSIRVNARLAPLAADHGATIAMAVAVREAGLSHERNAAAETRAWLEGALQYRADAWDDTVLRQFAARLGPEVASARILGLRSIERARQALLSGDGSAVRRIAREALALVGPRTLTGQRAELLLLLTEEDRVDPGQAELAAAYGRLRKQPMEGVLGARLKERLAMIEAALHQRHGRYKEAIRLFLGIPMESGLYRSARLGLAWCQFHIHQPERALKILALLPGGLSGDPERAVLAAMSAHALGQIEAAQAVIDAALAHRADLEAEEVSVELVVQAVASGRVKPLLRGPRENLTVMVAAQLDVLAAARTLLAYGDAPPKPGDCTFADATRQILHERVEAEAAAQLTRLRQAWDDLERLAPQIRERTARDRD
jgi:hypothetical protein